jgi:hypothetical protein
VEKPDFFCMKILLPPVGEGTECLRPFLLAIDPAQAALSLGVGRNRALGGSIS